MTRWSAQNEAEADPADVVEQLTPLDAEDRTDEPDPIEDVGEADPADVAEQAIEIGGDEGYERG